MELNFQYAHNTYEESETKTISDAQEVLKAFDEFDWNGEVQKANELKKCSPTLTLLLDSHEYMIWVSAWGEKNVGGFVSECHFPGEVSGFLGFGKKQGVVSLHANNFSTKQAREALSLFIAGSHSELRALYKNV